MSFVLNKIEDSFKDILINLITSNINGIFSDLNEKVSIISTNISKTPYTWNSQIYSLIKNLSQNLIIPIGSIIITAVLCMELISLVMERNNLNDFESFIFFKWFIKAFIAIYLLTHTLEFVEAIFEITSDLVYKAGNIINASTDINLEDNLLSLIDNLKNENLGKLLALSFETLIISLGIKLISVVITVILYGRMIEIYCLISLAPLPFSTFINTRFRDIGDNYIKNILALAFQGFLIIICVSIYSALINTIIISPDISKTIFNIFGYTLVLCFSLMKTGSLSKSIFDAK